ncbi:MAG: ABC transporter permease subunit [Acidobacteria bacterium]|nr:ABC transporter permease subunit [Acidobacteriota bacterium]
MIRFILRRLLISIPVIFLVATTTFFIMRLAPGGPFMSEKAIPPEIMANIQSKYGLDQPLLVQYGRYLKNLLQFDLGPSYKYPDRTVNQIIAEGFPVSLQLGLAALLFALFIGIIAGVLAAVKHGKALDHLAMAFVSVGIALPTFVIGPLLVFIFSLTLYWFPPALWGSPSQLVLPAITLGLPYAVYIARLTRTEMVEVLQQDYIRTARAKGVSEFRLLWKHARNGSLLPVVSFLGPGVADIVTGSIVVEKIFAIPGLGRFFVESAFSRDYTTVLGTVLFYAVLLILANLAVDIFYKYLDPRIEYQ